MPFKTGTQKWALPAAMLRLYIIYYIGYGMSRTEARRKDNTPSARWGNWLNSSRSRRRSPSGRGHPLKRGCLPLQLLQFSLQFLLLRKKREYRKISASDMILRDNKEAMSLLQRAGHQLSGWLIPRDGFINSIRDPKSPVKKELEKLCKVKILGENLTKRVARDGTRCRFAEGKS